MATRLTIRTLARIRADQRDDTFPTNTEANVIIDTVAHRVWRKLVRAGWKPNRTTQAITATGAASYDTSLTLSSLLEVYRIDGSTYIPLPRVKPEEIASYRSMGTGSGLAYDLFAGGDSIGKIEFFPRPTTGSYEIRFIPVFSGFASDSATWFGPEGSDELVAIGAAIQMLGKEGDDRSVAMLTAEYDALYAELCDYAGFMDQKGTATVRDVRYDTVDDSYDWTAKEGWF